MIGRIKEFLMTGRDYNDRLERVKEENFQKVFKHGNFQ
jgi:hypothetical protein